MDIIQQAVYESNVEGLTVLQSNHSIDILAPGVSKQVLVDKLKEYSNPNKSASVLCIGDKGRWPGNDFALLREPCSLSVDEVSSDPETCWNLAPSGHRGVQATLHYMNNLRPLNGKIKFVL